MDSEPYIMCRPYQQNKRKSLLRVRTPPESAKRHSSLLRCSQMSPPRLNLQGPQGGDESPVLRVTPVSRTYSRKPTAESGWERSEELSSLLPFKKSVNKQVQELPPKCLPPISDALKGLRLVDLGYVLEQYENIILHPVSCVKGNMRIVSEKLRGLKSLIYFRCDACGEEKVLQTHRSQGNDRNSKPDMMSDAPTGETLPTVNICGQVTIQPFLVPNSLTALETSQQLPRLPFSGQNIYQSNAIQPRRNVPAFSEPFVVEKIEIKEEQIDIDEDPILGMPEDSLPMWEKV